jgi:hypothetical protein
MRIRIGQYSLSIRELIITAIGIYVILLGFTYIGPFRFVGIIFLFLGLVLALRLVVLWFTWNGPLVGNMSRDSLGAIVFGLIGMILLLV